MSPHKNEGGILILYILWELCPFELKNFPKYTSEAACQCNSSETTKQNFMKPHSRKLLSPCSNDFKGVLFF
jgi:hypothetical protein